MRTTIRMDDALLREAKKLAAETGRTLTAVIEEAVRERLARARDAKRGARRKKPSASPSFPTFHAKLRPGVRLDNNAALLDIMEGRA